MNYARDIYLRFKDERSVTDYFGNLTIRGRRLTDLPDVAGAADILEELTEPLISTDGDAIYVMLPAGQVMITQPTEFEAAVVDDAIWVILRLSRKALDDDGVNSRIVGDIQSAGNADVKRGVQISHLKLGPGWVEVYNTDDLVSTGVLPHIFAGGPL